MKTIQEFLDQLDQVHHGGAWHGPSVDETLAGVDAEAATKRPIAGAHNIFEIVHHLRVVDDLVRSHFLGQPPGPEPDWPATTDRVDEGAWSAELAKLAASQRALRDLVAGLGDERLHETVPGKDRSFATELVYLLNHETYHAGQISLLRKAF